MPCNTHVWTSEHNSRGENPLTIYILQKALIPPNTVLIGRLLFTNQNTQIFIRPSRFVSGSSLQRPQEQFALCTVEIYYCGAKPRKHKGRYIYHKGKLRQTSPFAKEIKWLRHSLHGTWRLIILFSAAHTRFTFRVTWTQHTANHLVPVRVRHTVTSVSHLSPGLQTAFPFRSPY